MKHKLNEMSKFTNIVCKKALLKHEEENVIRSIHYFAQPTFILCPLVAMLCAQFNNLDLIVL